MFITFFMNSLTCIAARLRVHLSNITIGVPKDVRIICKWLIYQ